MNCPEIRSNKDAFVLRDGEMGGESDFEVFCNPESAGVWALVEGVRGGSVTGVVLSDWDENRRVFLIDWAGGRYIVKHELRGNPPWEKRLQERLHGPFHSRLMRQLLAARKAGCSVLQNIHLVAERMENGVCQETYLVLEYVEGASFASKEECVAHADSVTAAMMELHRFGLALGDVNFKNFVLSTDGAGERITFIDLSSRGFFRFGKIKDIVRMRLHYGIRLPVRGIVDSLLFAGIYIQQQLFYRFRLRRNDKTNPLR
jgi:tRNA A-37 threonylcarbamoyl transferase component Bud32